MTEGGQAPAPPRKILLIGFGNPARQDDGIGPEIARRIELENFDGVTVDSGYQLSVEDAAEVAEHDVVLFVDASIEAEEPFELTRVVPEHSVSFSSHSVSPEQVMGLADELFHAGTEGYVMAVRGYSFAMFTETMTEGAVDNLGLATAQVKSMLQTGDFRKATGGKR